MLLKALLRILHFLLYLFVYVTTRLRRRVQRFKLNLRYKAMWLLYGMPDDELEILERYGESRVTKLAKHSAIVVNRHQPRNRHNIPTQDPKEESLKVADIISWMLITGT